MKIGDKIHEDFTDERREAFEKAQLEMAFACEANGWCMEDGYEEDGKRYLIIKSPYIPTLSELRTDALSRINSVTSTAILSGFDYKINDEILHFSYNHEDQLNFSDTFNGIAMKKLMRVEDLPETIDWNGWRNPTESSKGELVVLTLTPEDFLTLYTKGAFVHKQTHLEIGKQRKKLINDATSIEEINSLLKEWNI